jgi:CubicO group peptidase (beta-lactamase class C family)
MMAIGSPLAGQHPADSTLVGVWGSELAYGPLVRGELTVVRRGPTWNARIAGLEATPRITADTIRFALPGDAGTFRGRFAPDRTTIAGFWIQPPGLVNGAAYASPLTLERSADGVWRGVVTPLDERFSLYLIVERRPDGSLWGSFHNPEANSHGGAGRFRIDRQGSSVRFVDTTNAGHRDIVATYDSAQQQLVVPWSDLGQPIVLTPLSRDRAVGLYARQRMDRPYAYRPPVAEGDGWPTAPAAAVGLDSARLTALVQYIIAQDPTADTAALIHSVLIARHGKLALEEYFYGFDDAQLHDLRSAAKTFASVLVGAAMMHGVAIGPGQPLHATFGPGRSFANPDPRKAKITVGHLMTHSTGLACDDNEDASPGNESTLQSQHTQPNWYTYMLDLPMTHEPGEHYAYCSGTMNLVGAALSNATGRQVPELFEQWVAEPLGIRRYAWNLMPTGEGYLGGGVYLSPRDLLKLGVTYLNAGIWNGHRIVSRSWAQQSTTREIGPPAATGVDGFAWHLNQLTANGRSYREYEANGNGGQFLIVLPELDVAVVFTGGDYNAYRVWRHWRDDLVPNYVIESIVDPAPLSSGAATPRP